MMAGARNGKKRSASSQSDLTDKIKAKAQELYEQSGRIPGRDMDNWLEAEKIVKAQ